MNKETTIKLLTKEQGHPVSENLYGIFFEDINFSCDGGINANLVKNYSFDGTFFDHEKTAIVSDPLRFWNVEGGTLQSGCEDGLSAKSKYAIVTVGAESGQVMLSNLGFNGEKQYQNDGAMSIVEGEDYLFEAYVKNVDFNGKIFVKITDDSGKALTETAELTGFDGTWKKLSASVKGIGTAYGKLILVFEGSGSLQLDCVSFMNADYWNKEDPKWKHGKLRKDLIQALADLKPSFMRFPGGCIVEGQIPGNEYDWKESVGELYERGSNYNLWSETIETGSYNQSFQIGFYEYFCLCEDLNMKPLPTLTVGLNCQIRSMQRGETVCPNIPLDSEEFKTKILDNYLDLIAFARDDKDDSKWGALRAKMGHPEPFTLERIGIGNENYGTVYLERFARIEQAIHEKYPEIVCVMCGGIHPFKESMMGLPGLDAFYEEARKYENILVDEHSYHSPEWFEEQSTRFDSYDRKNAGVYFGEYAANGMLGQLTANAEAVAAGEMPEGSPEGMRPMNESNQLDTALGEAAFLTGVERNSDIVAMASYAPLFNLVESDQWNHNLINFNPKTVCFSTNYYVQQMFGANLGTDYIPYEGELPEHTYFSATADETSHYMKLVNTSEAAGTLTIVLPFEAKNAEMLIMQSTDPHVRNALTFRSEAEYVITPEKGEVLVNGTELTVEIQAYSVAVIKVD